VQRRRQYVQDIFTIRSIAIKYRNGTAAFALFRGGRGGAALRARVAPLARGTTGVVPPDSGFGRRGRLQAFRSPATRREIESSRQAFSGGCKAYPSGGKRRHCACREIEGRHKKGGTDMPTLRKELQSKRFREAVDVVPLRQFGQGWSPSCRKAPWQKLSGAFWSEGLERGPPLCGEALLPFPGALQGSPSSWWGKWPSGAPGKTLLGALAGE
jgi:hypothetical protein